MKQWLWSLVSLSLLVCACQSLSAPSWLKSQSPAPTFSADNTAVVPAPRTDAGWVEREALIRARVKDHPDTQLIFVGDSITHLWETAPDLWNYYFGAYQPINMGIGGDQTQHVLWRLDHGCLEGIAPKVAVVMIGTNNCFTNTPEQIAEGVTAIVDRLRTRLPKTKILLLAIFPRNEKPDALREKLNQVNRIIAKLGDNKHIFYLDIGQSFLAPDGSLSKEIMPDFLHPNWVGYDLWALSIKDQLAELEK